MLRFALLSYKSFYNQTKKVKKGEHNTFWPFAIKDQKQKKALKISPPFLSSPRFAWGGGVNGGATLRFMYLRARATRWRNARALSLSLLIGT